MTPIEKSVIGFAKQTAKCVTASDNVPATETSYNYMLFTKGAISPTSTFTPLDQEVGGGALVRDVMKTGVMSNGQLEFIPRPETLGHLLCSIMGADTSTLHATATTSYDHVFKMATDQFSVPYYTWRSAPGYMWGEQFQDCRTTALALRWQGANFLRGSIGITGGLPKKIATTGWTPTGSYLDTGPQFLAPISAIELPTSSAVKCIEGAFTAAVAIPMDSQWVVGSYTPDDFDITSRIFAINLTLKITDASLYTKMMYDYSASGATASWAADMLKEGSFKLNFKSNVMAEGLHPYELTIAANGSSSNLGNVAWSVTPIGLRPGGQVVINATGMFLADSTLPIAITLTNKHVAAYTA